ncbi:unnamed protein product [Withania somnifera]
MEGGPHKADKTEFTECWKTSWKTPYIMRLAFLFGYHTGVISGALLYIRDDFKSVDKHTWLQETIVSMAVAGAIFGAGFGGWLNDKCGRKKSILLADILFFVGALIMAVAPVPWVIIIGRVLVGLGVGMASMTSPVYISEASPARIRGGTWRWMLGVAGFPALVQFFLMLSLPESPRWMYRANKKDEARAILEKIYPAHEVEDEMKALEASIETEKADEDAWCNRVVRRGLYAGITVQVAQQFVGINTVMYYSSTIVQLAGFASNKTALAYPTLITSCLSALGSIVSMCFVDRYGRRRLMIVSMFGIISCLVILSVLFMQASKHVPLVSAFESNHFGSNSTCSACLQASKDSAFCSNGNNKYHPGACLALNDSVKGLYRSEKREWYTKGCPSKFGFFAVMFLGLYIISYSPGMGTVPWIVNSEIYPLRYRGIGGGIAAVSNWVSNLIVSESFLTLTEAIGSAGTFLLFAGFSTTGLIAIYFLVPETKGLQFEEVEKMLEKGYKPKLFRNKVSLI